MYLFNTPHHSYSQTKEEQAVVIEKLRKAMAGADKSTLASLVSDQLSNGHSPGYIADNKVFVDNILKGKSGFVSLKLMCLGRNV